MAISEFHQKCDVDDEWRIDNCNYWWGSFTSIHFSVRGTCKSYLLKLVCGNCINTENKSTPQIGNSISTIVTLRVQLN